MTGVSSSWKQRQQAWSNPANQKKQDLAAQVAQEAQEKALESERQESFDQVYLEVFGRQEHERASAKAGTEQYNPGALVASTTGSVSVYAAALDGDRGTDERPSEAKASLPQSQPTTSGELEENASTSSTSWGFKSTAKPAIRLDDFEMPASSNRQGDTTGSSFTGGGYTDAGFVRYKDANASHSVSDNFVKLNMRKRVKGSTGKAKKRPAYLRARFDPSDAASENPGGAANDAFMDPLSRASRDSAKSKFESSQALASSGFMNDGLDFIEECLEVLARVESQQLQQQGSGEDQSSHAQATDEQLSALLPVPKEDEEVPPPRCHHALSCGKVVVKKKNKNHGRVFFACPLGFEEGRCDFFLWEDDHTQVALKSLFSTLQQQAQDGGEDATIRASHPEYVPLDLSKSVADQEDALVTNLRLVFGHAGFREGQQWAISRVFQQKNTLLVLPTGAGKSLCYQYPALFLPGITIVISPLISLMNDQFQNLPPLLKAQAACLASSSASGGNSKAKYAEFVRDLLGGKLKVVFLSPEKAVSHGFQQLLVQVRARVSLVCVDEAHCISEWSHHFRPSYLRLQSVFRFAKCVLAITATASNRVVADILHQFKGDSEMVLQMPWQRSNLELQVRRVQSNDERIEHLVRFLSTTKLQGGIIMYVHQQRQAEDMAAVLKDQLPGSAWQRKIAFYHARMDADAKEKVRLGFLSGRLRVVIATIAFGMGIDKQNVRCVVHFHLPSSVENYLQQVGRAGRDGKRATGLLYLLPDDVQTFRSLAFTNAFHEDQLRRLVTRVVFAGEGEGEEADDEEAEAHLHHIVAVSDEQEGDEVIHVTMEMEWLETYLDMKAATIETFLTLMALKNDAAGSRSSTGHEDAVVKLQLQPSSMSVCVIHVIEKKFRDAPAESTLKRIVNAITSSSSLQHKVKLHAHIEKETNGYLSMLVVHFHVREMAHALFGLGGNGNESQPPLYAPLLNNVSTTTAGGLHERRLLQHVRKMQQDGQIQRFTLEKQAFRVDLRWTQDVISQQQTRANIVNEWTHALYAKHLQLEAMEVGRLTRLYGALHASSLACGRRSNGHEDADDAEEDMVLEKARVLEQKLVAYFETEAVAQEDDQLMKTLLQPLTPKAIEAIEQDVRSIIQLAVFEDNGEGEGPENDFSMTPTNSYNKSSSSTGKPYYKGSSKSKSKQQAKKRKTMTQETQRQLARTQWTSHSVAKVFHGIASPCFPLLRWKDHGCWKKYDAFAFEQLVTIGEKVLREEQGKGDELDNTELLEIEDTMQ